MQLLVILFLIKLTAQIKLFKLSKGSVYNSHGTKTALRALSDVIF